MKIFTKLAVTAALISAPLFSLAEEKTEKGKFHENDNINILVAKGEIVRLTEIKNIPIGYKLFPKRSIIFYNGEAGSEYANLSMECKSFDPEKGHLISFKIAHKCYLQDLGKLRESKHCEGSFKIVYPKAGKLDKPIKISVTHLGKFPYLIKFTLLFGNNDKEALAVVCQSNLQNKFKWSAKPSVPL